MRRVILSLFALIVFVVMLAPSLAYAADAAPAPNPVLSQVLTEVVKLVAAIVLIFGGFLAKKAVKAIEDKTGMDVSAKEEAMVDGWVNDGVHFAEEKALQWVKEKASKPLPNQKLETAFDFVWDQVQEMGLVGWTREMVTAKIQAVVNQKRADGGIIVTKQTDGGVIIAKPKAT